MYFSCHPADFDKYFETICADIFATQDCAIYYESDWENKAEESALKTDLSDMQLFVIPISTIFLLEDNRAKLFEYGFAMEEHIPVLPVAMESGLEEVFTKRLNDVGAGYGDVQYLDRTSNDNTQISYAEKLESRLSSTLIGNELAERVRAAFDAYIFLSYRKKDRAMAKELMRLIHRIPFCRDIAIWYDEFLVPGEAWNNAIAEALKKSSLVTMMVTPSLIEPGNFIIEHEYPDAVAAGKEVLPAEVVPTDRDALADLFKNISVPFDGTDESVMAEKLMAVATTQNDDNPEHNYLIGLAYLGAIDVERDYERAVELITSAAEAGLPEAMEKLADMYNTGKGVKRDYQTAVAWMGKCCNALALEDEHSLAYYKALDKCGDMWNLLGQMHDARTYFEKAMTVCEFICQANPYYDIRHELAMCYGSLVEVNYYEEKKAEATAYCRKALAIREELANETQTIEDKDLYATSCADMGMLLQAEGKFSEAAEYYELSLRIREEILKESDTEKTNRAVAVVHYHLGDLFESEGKLKEAESHYNSFMITSLFWAKQTKSILSRHDLSISYVKLGELHMRQGLYKAARQELEDYMRISEELVAENGALSDRRELAGSYLVMGVLCEKEGNRAEARPYYEKSLAIYSQLVIETNMIMHRRSVSEVLLLLADNLEAEKKYEEAHTYFARNLILREELDQELHSNASSRALATAHFFLGRNCVALRRYEEAEVNYYIALEKFHQLSQDVGSVEIYLDYAVGLWNVAAFKQYQGKYKDAITYYTIAGAVYRLLYEKTGDENYHDIVQHLVKDIVELSEKAKQT